MIKNIKIWKKIKVGWNFNVEYVMNVIYYLQKHV